MDYSKTANDMSFIGKGITIMKCGERSSYSAEATALFSAITGTQPSAVTKGKIDSCIRYMKGNNSDSRNTWVKLCCFIPFHAGMPTAADALIWWNDPTRKAVLSGTPPTYVLGSGFTGNGTSSYIDTDWNPTEDADSKYTQNACSSGFLFTNHRTIVGGGGNGLINGSSEGTICTPLYSDGSTYTSIQGIISSEFGIPAQIDYLWSLVRYQYDEFRYYLDKTVSGSAPYLKNSIALLNGNIYLLAYNIIGTGAAVFSSDTIGLFYAGSVLDQTDINVLNDAIALL